MTCSTPAGVQAALEYIESHLEQKLTLEAIAAAVHYSPYHLHRSFAACTGQTLCSYAVRRQITQAAKYLIVTEAPILDIALGCGYASQQSFSAAFKALYKLPPAQYRSFVQIRITIHHGVDQRQPSGKPAACALYQRQTGADPHRWYAGYRGHDLRAEYRQHRIFRRAPAVSPERLSAAFSGKTLSRVSAWPRHQYDHLPRPRPG